MIERKVYAFLNILPLSVMHIADCPVPAIKQAIDSEISDMAGQCIYNHIESLHLSFIV